MRRLIERVEVDPPAGGRDRPCEVAVRLECRDEAVEHPADGALDRGSPRRAPVVELGAVAEREPRHERAARQLGGDCEVPGVSRGAERLESRDVDVVVRRNERDLLSVDAEDVRPDGTAEHRQRPAEGAARRCVVRVRPQERRKLLPAVRPSIRREDGQDRNRLAGIDLERAALDHDLGRAEEPDLDSWRARAGCHRAQRYRTRHASRNVERTIPCDSAAHGSDVTAATPPNCARRMPGREA